MNIKNAIDYAQLALKKAQEENKITNKELDFKQLGELMWLMYYNYNEKQAHDKATSLLKTEAKND